MLKGKGEDASAVMAEVGGIGDELKANEARSPSCRRRLAAFLRVIPNIPRADVPDGRSADDNVEVRRWGTPRTFDFPREGPRGCRHGAGRLDFDTAAKLSGARFSVLKGAVARLHRALAQFMLDVQTREHGYTEVYVPYMVNGECADGVSSLAKFKDDLFKIEGRDLYLIPTAEYPVTNFVRDSIVDAKDLPLQVRLPQPVLPLGSGQLRQGHARHDPPAPVRQGGDRADRAARRDRPRRTRSSRATPRRSCRSWSSRTASMLLCTGDTGLRERQDLRPRGVAAGRRTPTARSRRARTSRASRRGACRRASGTSKGKTEPVHTINGSGLAVGRTLVAVLENYQNADGSVTVPKALVPYMNGTERLDAEASVQ